MRGEQLGIALDQETQLRQSLEARLSVPSPLHDENAVVLEPFDATDDTVPLTGGRFMPVSNPFKENKIYFIEFFFLFFRLPDPACLGIYL